MTSLKNVALRGGYPRGSVLYQNVFSFNSRESVDSPTIQNINQATPNQLQLVDISKKQHSLTPSSLPVGLCSWA